MSFLSSALPALGTIAGTIFGGPAGAAIGGAAGSLLGGALGGGPTSAGNAALAGQAGLARTAGQQQQQLFGAALPYYGGSLHTLFANAGYGLPPGAVYNAPQQQAQFQAAQNTLGNRFNADANTLRFRFNQAGIGGGALGSGLENLQRGNEQELADFRRQMAINAVDLQNQRYLQALQAANPGLASSPIAAGSLLGGAAGQYFGRADTQNQALGNALQQFAAYMQLQGLGNQAGGTGYTPSPYGPAYTPYTPPGLAPVPTNPLIPPWYTPPINGALGGTASYDTTSQF